MTSESSDKEGSNDITVNDSSENMPTGDDNKITETTGVNSLEKRVRVADAINTEIKSQENFSKRDQLKADRV